MNLRWYHAYYWIATLLLIAGGWYLWRSADLYANVVKFPLVPPFFIGVYPVSVVMIGAALAAYTWKYKWRGLPLVAMFAGIFDLSFPTSSAFGPIRILQVGLALGGFLLSGTRAVKSGFYVGIVIGIYYGVISGYLHYWGYEAALFVFGFGCLDFPEKAEKK